MNIERHSIRKEIHRKLKQHSPKAVHKAKKIVGFKYLKLILLLVSISLAYYIFSNLDISSLIPNFKNLSYIGAFISGVLITFGFSAPFSVGFLITLQPNSIFLAAIIGGVGAAIGDFFIFKTIKFSFMNEFEELKKTRVIHKIRKMIYNNKHILIKHYILYVFAGIVIATPLPDEIGVSMLAGLTSIKPLRLIIISFILHTSVILLILIIVH